MDRKRSGIYIESYALNILAVIFISVALSCVNALLSDVADMGNIMRYLRAPQLFAINALPLMLLMLFLYHVSSRHWVGSAFGGGLLLLMHLVNRFKIQLREEPFTPDDLLLGTEAAKVVKFSELPFSTLIIASIIIWFLFTLFLFIFVRSKKLDRRRCLAGMAAVVLLSATAFFTIYKNVGLFTSFKVTGSIYSRVNTFKSRGFAYSFLVRTATMESIKPAGYSKDDAGKILERYAEPSYVVSNESVKLPNVLAVMGEAFYDIDRIKGVEFNEGFNPLANFRRLSGQAWTGRIVTEVFGGGTANTEFSFLTGGSLAVLPGLSSPYTYNLRKDAYSLARVMKKAGYDTLAFHPGDSWFYNRANVYRFFGFDRIYFRRDMDQKNLEINFGYVSDKNTVQFTLDKLKQHIAEKPDSPFFEFVVNIDNHGPYSKQDLDYPEILKRKPGMNDTVYNNINNYLNGLDRCDKALGYLADSIGGLNEPVVLLFFADHLPALGEGGRGFKALGLDVSQTESLQAYLNQYETPYFIWCNKAAESLLKSGGIAPEKGAAPEISANYLAAELLKYIGMNGGNYLNYLSEQEALLPVITGRFVKEGGNFTEAPSPGSVKRIEQYRELEYYMLMERESINGGTKADG
ncbi:MAG TPA: LTA synthase family protein [Clostridia bacterium]|nr:LTA synthase family protein [Clostridia bacterium]